MVINRVVFQILPRYGSNMTRTENYKDASKTQKCSVFGFGLGLVDCLNVIGCICDGFLFEDGFLHNREALENFCSGHVRRIWTKFTGLCLN